MPLPLCPRLALRGILTVLTALLVLASAPAFAEQRIALVIGNGNYTNGRLINPANDARTVAEAMRETGFAVSEVIDANRETMRREIRAFAKKVSAAGREAAAVFYFAGHGLQVNGRNFLVPIGANLQSPADVEYETVEAQWVLDLIGESRAGLSVIILDACRNNPFPAVSRAASRGLARMDAPRGSILAFSTAPGDVALDGNGHNSPYTAALAEKIRTPGLKIEEMFKQVRRDVLASTSDKQIPWESSSLVGDFYFSGGAGSASAPAAVAYAPSSAAPSVPAGQGFSDCAGCPDMVSIGAGQFLLGSAGDEWGRNAHENPQTPVDLRPFAIGKTEVSVGQFRQFIDETGYDPGQGCWHFAVVWLWDEDRSWQAPGYAQTDASPILCVKWQDAQAYTQWLSRKTGQRYRLPSEAEWEYVAEGGDDNPPWGTNFDLACADANIYDRSGTGEFGTWWSHSRCDDGFSWPSPVGSLNANPLGVHDMIGNAYEWTQDCWNGDHNGHPGTGDARSSGDCNLRVRKGGHYVSPTEFARPAWREAGVAVHPNIYNSFRVARDMN